MHMYDQQLVRVHATSIHADVWHMMRGLPYVMRFMGAGLRGPKDVVPGTDLSGVVERVGKGVRRFQPGDEVFGQTLVANLWRHGAVRRTRRRSGVEVRAEAGGPHVRTGRRRPTSGSLAVQGVRDEGRIQAGHRVLINGAGGAVGTFAVQLAKALGAEVTAVDAAEKLEMLRAIGADRVVDYGQKDFTGATRDGHVPETV
jgi:NADPH:quinone reductase-like Zn-dependent oxidoreductase